MPKSKNSAKAQPSMLPVDEVEIPSQHEESTSSDQASEAEVSFHTHRPQAPPQFPPSMFMPYIEGPHMDWTVNDGLYHRFLKWRLKCKNILECELAALPECQKCKKVLAWSGHFGMDQYVSWSLPKEDLSLDTIWEHFEEFCKLQVNEVRAYLDLLTSFKQGTRSVDEWYNMVQAQINLAKYPPETAKTLHRDIIWFFLPDVEFVSKTINEGRVDLDKFSLKQGMPACQEDGKLQGHSKTHKTGGWRSPSSPNKPKVPPMHRIIKWQVREEEIFSQAEASIP